MPEASCPGKNADASGWNFDRFAIHPGRANVAGHTTSLVITSGVADPETNRCCNCCSATSDTGDSGRMLTWIFGLAFSNAATAAFVAAPSPPRPWVANTIVCDALAGTWAVPAP